ncbi:MAG: zinc ribbon domain-containing protein [Natronomonas sp.]
MRGILAVGAYAPQSRVSADAFAEAWGSFDAPGIETKAVPDADEDTLTIGIEAARRALEATGDEVAGTDIAHLSFATTTPPLAEEDLTARLGSFLEIPDDATRRTHTGSTCVGIDGLVDALETDGRALLIAADSPRGEPDDAREHAAGAGGVAFLVGSDAPATVSERVDHASTRPGTRFRRAGRTTVEGLEVGTYDRAAYVEPVTAAVDAIESIDPKTDPDAVALQAPNGGLPYRATGPAGLDESAVAAVETVSELGDTGATSVPLSIARAFKTDAQRTLAIAWGSGGGTTALVLDGRAPVVADLESDGEIDYPAYLRRRGDVVGSKPDGGAAHVSVPTFRRSLPQRHRHVAGRCPDCASLAFPPEGACPTCGELIDFDPVTLPLNGEIRAVTTIGQGGAPPEFAEQQARQGEFGVAIVRFEAAGTVDLPMQVIDDADVGDSITAVPRMIYVEEGVPRYGLKALPS